VPFQGMRQAHTEVHWAIQDFGKERSSTLPFGFATTVVRCAGRIRCLSVEEMSACS
jgi:hypothetical protein